MTIDDAGRTSDHAPLRRVIGVQGIAAASFNCIVGAGIFGLPAVVAAALGPAAILAYGVCLVLVALMGLCFAESGSRVSDSGGFYAYAAAAFGPVTAGTVGMLTVIANQIASSAALARFLIEALAILWPAIDTPIASTVFLAIVYGALALVNIHGVRDGVALARLLALVKIVPLVLLVAVGAFAVRPVNLVWHEVPTLGAVAATSMLLVFAFMGMEGGLSVGGETRDPARTVPRGILLALTLVGALYIGLQLVAQGVLGAALAGEKAPLIATATQVFGHWGTKLMLVTTVLSATGYLVSDMLTGPRVPFALAERGQLPRALAYVHPRHKTPSVAILAYAGLAFALAASGTFRQLVILATSGSLTIYFICCLGVLRLRAKGVAMDGPPFRAPGGPLVPLAAAGLIIALMWTLTWAELAATLSLATLSALGYAVLGWRRKRLA
jgi:APA family basic amino acid/polyamine antiporter